MRSGPARSRPAGSEPEFVLDWVERLRLARAALLVSRLAAHHVLLGPLPVWRWLYRRLDRHRLNLIGPHVDARAYVAQLPAGWRRFAARDPVLHYGLVGRFRDFSPRPGFDPVFYRADNPEIGFGRDPLAHYARRLLSGPRGAPPPPTSKLDTRRPPDGLPEPTRGHVVTLNHARGGGSDHFLDLYEDRLLADGFRVTRLARDTMKAPIFRALPIDGRGPAGPPLDLFGDTDALKTWLKEARASRLVVNHIIDLPLPIFDLLPKLGSDLQLPVEIILHDYLVLCPRINLVDADGRFCGGPPGAECPACVRRKRDSLATQAEPAAWRRATGRLLSFADRIVVPSQDTAARIAAYWPELGLTVWEPETDAAVEAPAMPTLGPDEPLRIAIIGGLNTPKGFEVVERLARYAKERRLPLSFTLVGPSRDDAALAASGVQVTGRYRERDVDEAIKRQRPHVVLVPAIWPETWSFTLTHALRLRLPVFAFDHGAVGERLRRLGHGALLPPDLQDRPDRLAEVFLRARQDAVKAAA